jgi:hypothetical protein
VDVGFLAVKAVCRGLQGELHVVWCRTPNFAVASASYAFGAKYLLVDCTISVQWVARPTTNGDGFQNHEFKVLRQIQVECSLKSNRGRVVQLL